MRGTPGPGKAPGGGQQTPDTGRGSVLFLLQLFPEEPGLGVLRPDDAIVERRVRLGRLFAVEEVKRLAEDALLVGAQLLLTELVLDVRLKLLALLAPRLHD